MSGLGAPELGDSFGPVGGEKRTIKVMTLTQVNTRILEVAVESPSDALEWEFFCECGRPACHAQVALTVEAFALLRDVNRPVLAPGHR